MANGALSGDDFYTGTANIVCNAGYTGGGSATCLQTAVWDTLPTCNPRGIFFYDTIYIEHLYFPFYDTKSSHVK